jgi:ArsR family transcriptional regulator
LQAELFRVLGHPVRVRLLELLGTMEGTVGALREALGLEASSASGHLATLRRLGLVESRKVGTSVHYRIADRRTLSLLTMAQRILVASLEERRSLAGHLRGGTAAAEPPPVRPATQRAETGRVR